MAVGVASTVEVTVAVTPGAAGMVMLVGSATACRLTPRVAAVLPAS